MLVSHRKQFIFTKTVKTAGTSVESYFEPYCMPEGQWERRHGRAAQVSDAGIVGYRGGFRPKTHRWHAHMPAAEIRERVGEDVWQNYFKFTVIRNPFDKLVSRFYFFEKRRKERLSKSVRFKRALKRFYKTGRISSAVRSGSDIERFRQWVRESGAQTDRHVYMIDGRVCVDYFIRFENLKDGLQHVCERVDVPFDWSAVPEFKKGIRPHRHSVREYYDAETEAMVRKMFAWELDAFGYDLPD